MTQKRPCACAMQDYTIQMISVVALGTTLNSSDNDTLSDYRLTLLTSIQVASSFLLSVHLSMKHQSENSGGPEYTNASADSVHDPPLDSDNPISTQWVRLYTISVHSDFANLHAHCFRRTQPQFKNMQMRWSHWWASVLLRYSLT